MKTAIEGLCEKLWQCLPSDVRSMQGYRETQRTNPDDIDVTSWKDRIEIRLPSGERLWFYEFQGAIFAEAVGEYGFHTAQVTHTWAMEFFYELLEQVTS